MYKKTKGFALVQALFFMMFIMAIISITMLMSNQRAVNADAERMATDAYPALNAFISAVANDGKTDSSGNLYTNGTQYFADYPLSSSYITRLTKEGFSDPTQSSSTGPNLVLTIT